MMHITAEDASAFHKATGCSIAKAVEVLEQIEPLRRERILLASRLPKRSLTLRDPIESDPELSGIIRNAAEEASKIVSAQGTLKRGSCHSIWREQARILLERHQVVWFSPSEMNPGVLFD